MASAVDLLHRNGVARTTLAHVANDADVPVGNVYYYFKTKDELVQAVIDSHADTIRTMLGSFEQHASPRERLIAFARGIAGTGELAAQFGCPHGSLCTELDKRDDGLDQSASALMAIYVDWAEEQFRLMGHDDARDLAVTLIATYQGASLLTNAFRDPSIMASQARQRAGGRGSRWGEGRAPASRWAGISLGD